MIPFHPIAGVFPLLEGAAFDELVADIRTHDLREPVILFEGQILDGRNRYRACIEAGRDCHYAPYNGNDPVAYVVSLNLHRRHLNESQRAMVAAKIANLPQGRPAADKGANLPLFDRGEPSPVRVQDAAGMLNVSERTVKHATVVRESGAPELVSAVEQGRVAVSTAADIARLPQEQQREIVACGEAQILEAAKKIRADKAEARKIELALVRAAKVFLPDGRFEVIVMDPPWPMEKIERDMTPNQTAFDYPTMSEDELIAYGAEVQARTSDDCHFFMWTTQRFLPMAFNLTGLWGFRYVCLFTWHKAGGFQPFGLPQYNAEHVVYARKGSPEFVDLKAFPCCFTAPRREHSRKPDEFYEMIARVTHGRRVDWFARAPRADFETIGNETEKFAVVA